MTGTNPRSAIIDFLHAGWLLVCLSFSACQSHGEHHAAPTVLDPKITVQEVPPKPLSSELVDAKLPPVPVQTTVAAQPTAVPDAAPAKLIAQPPVIVPPTVAQPVSYTPKQSGLSAALEHFLLHRNDDAIIALKAYPTDDQDAALVMLPILARFDQGENWMTLSGPQKLATLESLRSLCKRLSKTAPLVMQRVTLVDKQPDRFGEVKPRNNGNYYPEDWVHAYAELVNLLDFINPEGLYNVRLEVTLELHGLNDQIYWQASCPFQKAGSIGSRNDYHVAINFNMPKQITGAYQLVIIVLDRDTNRTAKQVLPLQILDQKNKSNGAPKRRNSCTGASEGKPFQS